MSSLPPSKIINFKSHATEALSRDEYAQGQLQALVWRFGASLAEVFPSGLTIDQFLALGFMVQDELAQVAHLVVEDPAA